MSGLEIGERSASLKAPKRAASRIGGTVPGVINIALTPPTCFKAFLGKHCKSFLFRE